MKQNFDIDELIDNNEVIICGGSGGVGKTTTSATIGIRAALRGKKVLVCTIDPARRLANSLGLGEMTGEEKQVDASRFESAGTPMKGDLTALMIDMKRSFDEMVERYAPNEEVKNRIFTNNLYKNVSTALAGSQEYIAMQKLADIYESKRFDLIVLDTPPTRHALDFLEAPAKITDFFSARVIDFLFKPGARVGKFGYKLFQRSGSAVLGALEKLTGAQLLADMADFFEHFDALLVEFNRQGEGLQNLLSSDNIVFLIVTSPDPLALEESMHLYTTLAKMNLRFGGFVVNRVRRDYGVDLEGYDETVRSLHEAPAPDNLPEGKATFERLLENFSSFLTLAKGDRNSLKVLSEKTGGRVKALPFFNKDVYDVPDLLAINSYLDPDRTM